ncbi:alpha/beta hydrolase [Sungkyunkwania multivorans]|uniref:Alpha/beta hydrolase n=1 Tax=Sungkyunkwania multivorans TaxID=1173618 RepID=A0ABW3CWT0_9FLAO
MLRKVITKFFLPVGVFYMSIALLMTIFQEKLLFMSDTLPNEYRFGFANSYKELFLKNGDDAVLNGIHFTKESPKGVILYFHGNKGELDRWGAWGEQLLEKYEYDVVVWDYRGYGKSTGERTIEAMLEDGQLFYNYCKSLYPESDIVLWGRSLGGAFASHIARNNDPKKLILESTFTEIEDVAKRRYGFLPIDILLRYPFQNIENIEGITADTYIIHGNEDALVPFEMGKTLYQRSKAKNKHFFRIDGGEHNKMNKLPQFHEAIGAILR